MVLINKKKGGYKLTALFFVIEQEIIIYLISASMNASTRRFFILPSGVSLEATGLDSP